jgi:DNA-binding transcriptional LysR family regulator
MERSSVDLLDVLAFVRVAETGAFSRAAERMGMAKSILSRRVARLEEQLGARLLTRTAQGAQPTEVGQAYFERASNILADLEAAQEVVAEAVTQVAGPVRLSAPLSFGVQHLRPGAGRVRRANPRVELDISFDDRSVDLAAGGFDLAVRIGSLKDSALIARGSLRSGRWRRRARPISRLGGGRSIRATSPTTTSCSTPTSNGDSGSAASGNMCGGGRG